MGRGGDEGGARPAAQADEPPPVRSRARDEILRLHQQLYQRQKQLIHERVHGYTPAFRAYEQRFERGVRQYERPAPFEEVVQAALSSEVVHVGDYHTLKQAQRWYLKLVHRLVEAGRHVVLALEFVEARHQPLLDRFLAGRLSQKTFLERTGYAQRHTFDVWPHFKPIFEFARAHGLPVVAVERAGGGDLEKRDRFFARRIGEAVRSNPGAVVAVLVGQLHCAPRHLPACVATELGRKGITPRQLVVYQNADPIWFRLEKQGIEHDTEAVLVRPGEYCLINTSPLVAQQSYLDWVDDGELVETSAPEKHFKELARLIARFLELDLGDALDRVSVYTAGDLSFLEGLRAGGLFNARELGLIRRQILARESYYIPRAHIAYLAGLSINHAAEEAAHFLRHVVTGDHEPEHGLIDSFYARALEEAFAFFGSKIVNPRRKTAHPEDFEKRRRTCAGADRRIAELVLAHLALENGLRAGAFKKFYGASDPDLFNDVTHALGYILGDRMYWALIRGELTRQEARRLFREPLDGDGEAFALYFATARRFSKVRVPRHP